MSPDTSLSQHTFDDYLWIRCSGRGSFINSPSLKKKADKHIAKGGQNIVVDLENCQGVDSTFMGTLAGIARICAAAEGTLQIASPTARTRAAMEGLGLDMMLELDPEHAPWQSQLESIRSTVAQSDNADSNNDSVRNLSEMERTQHVLDAHKTLSSINDKNEETFGYVCESLEADLERQHEEEHN